MNPAAPLPAAGACPHPCRGPGLAPGGPRRTDPVSQRLPWGGPGLPAPTNRPSLAARTWALLAS
eukprot:13017280-Heterocapsa_arctica.AAC.1